MRTCLYVRAHWNYYLKVLWKNASSGNELCLSHNIFRHIVCEFMYTYIHFLCNFQGYRHNIIVCMYFVPACFIQNLQHPTVYNVRDKQPNACHFQNASVNSHKLSITLGVGAKFTVINSASFISYWLLISRKNLDKFVPFLHAGFFFFFFFFFCLARKWYIQTVRIIVRQK